MAGHDDVVIFFRSFEDVMANNLLTFVPKNMCCKISTIHVGFSNGLVYLDLLKIGLEKENIFSQNGGFVMVMHPHGIESVKQSPT